MSQPSKILKIVALSLLGTLMFPVFAFAQTAPTAAPTALEGELANLLAEIEQLENASTTSSQSALPTTSPMTSTGPTPPAPASSNIICPKFVRTLSRGSTGTDVAQLQAFLAQNPIIYPEAAVTAYFGVLTQDAVQRWQSAYSIVSSGTPATTGYGVVGPRTAAAITASCMNNSNDSSSAAPTTSSEEPLCPVAPEPATPCPGTWSPLTNATGCTIAWQCAIPLPGFATSSASASSVASTSVSTCAAYTLPLCTGGTDEWLGVSNGCNLGYRCVIPGQ